MKGKVRIVIEGMIGDKEGSITTDAVGEYRLFNGKHIIRYKKADMENGKESDTVIKILPGTVEMIKKGENNTRMVFDLTKETCTDYNTPYGSLRFRINTSRIDIDHKDQELIVRMEYSLSHNNELFSDNRVKITVKEM